MINWDPISETVVSDLEVDTVEENGHLWHIRYPIVGGGDIIVATTRPETMLGDTAVAVNSHDERYTAVVGKEIELPLTGRRIPIVALELNKNGKIWPDPAYGTGAVKVTPAHDPNDYDASQAAGLPIITVIDTHAKMIAPAPAKYIGMSVDQARKAVVEDLEAAGFLVEIKPQKVPRGRSQRSGAVIEPMLMEQWWVKAAPLAEKAVQAVEQGKTKFVPELHTKTFMHWMTNIEDWCISRQLWWGHRIPAWHCEKCQAIAVARSAPAACGACGGAVRQDEDILDTWFSSGLWPFSTLGWPEKTRALATFYPNNVLVTGPDIIFFWVARMMMMGLHFMGKVPFKTVYLTSIVTDEKGGKMSKTKGNVIDPLDIVHGASIQTLLDRVDTEKPPTDHDQLKKELKKNFKDGIPPMGADALRFALAALNTSGSRIRLSVDRVETYRNFINKLWNASRFALTNFDGYDAERFEAQHASPAGRATFAMPDRWILSRLQAACAAVDTALEAFKFNDAANAIWHFVWDELCDWYIELAKPHLWRADGQLEQDALKNARRHTVQGVLATALETTMRLLHPFAPFVTEEIWQKLPKPPQLPGSLMITVFPQSQAMFVDAAAEADMALVQGVVGHARMLRQTYGLPPAQSVDVWCVVGDSQQLGVLQEQHEAIQKIGKLKLAFGGAPTGGMVATSVVSKHVLMQMPLGGLIDPKIEQARIAKDIEKVVKEIGIVEKKLANADFMSRAPEDVIAEQHARLAEEQGRKARLEDALALLGSSS